MAKKGRHRKDKKGGRVTPKGTQPRGAAPKRAAWRDRFGPPDGPAGPFPDDEPDLLADVRRALDEDHACGLLSLASSLLAVADPRSHDPFAARDPDLPDPAELVRTFIEVDRPETSALMAAMATLLPDDVLRQAVDRELARRGAHLPAWLAGRDRVEVDRAADMTHILGDDDNLMVGLRLVGGDAVTIVVLIDHNLGSVVKDGFIVPEPIDDVIALMRARSVDLHSELHDVSLGDARARLVEAIERGAITVPRFETDTWPACRAIVEWITRMLPEGGTGHQRPEWSEPETQALADRFFASPEGVAIDDADHRNLLDTVLWFATDYGPGDPLRWSPDAVEILLEDWVPRKIAAEAVYLAKVPDLLRAFIRFCHHERDIPGSLTDVTLDAVDECEGDYQKAISSPRLQGPFALLEAMGALDPDLQENMFDPAALAAPMLASLEDRVGGADVLESLGDEPLPDEDFAWDGIAEDVVDRVGEVLALCDDACDTLLDVEYRTACRRLLARIATGGTEGFRRRGRTETAAAAVAWLVGHDNDLFEVSGGTMYVKDLLGHFGVTGSVSTRAGSLLRTAGLDDARGYGFRCPPDLLVSARRRRILELRDRYQAMGAGSFPAGLTAGAVPGGPVRGSAPSAADSVHRLKITLKGIRPPVWRRVEVASDTTLTELHDVIQVAFGWEDAHLHDFEIDGQRYGTEDFMDWEDSSVDEDAVTLGEVAPEGTTVRYTYDFGDSWEHRIAIEAVTPPEPGETYPRCLAGRRAGPPEDVGGTFGYEHLLEVLADPAHPEYEELSDWADGPLDPDRFDPDEVNRDLRSLSAAPRSRP